MLTSLAGKTVIVTGASKGIGRGIAKRFGLAGLNVLVVSRHLDEAKKVAGEIGANASAFAADVSEAEPCQAMAAAALERYGRIDILCANAGIFPAAKLGEMTAADFDQVIGVNLKGTFLSVSAVLPAMKAQEERPHRHHVLDHRPDHRLSRLVALRCEQSGPARLHAHRGDRTRALQHHRQCGDAGQHLHRRPRGLGQDYLTSMAACIPMKRLGTVEDIANAVLYFASEEAGVRDRADDRRRWRPSASGIAGSVGADGRLSPTRHRSLSGR